MGDKYDLILTKMRTSFESEKEKALKNLHDYDFYGLAIQYELCEWLENMADNNSLSEKELNALYEEPDPLGYLYGLWLGSDDNLWEMFGDLLQEDVAWACRQRGEE